MFHPTSDTGFFVGLPRSGIGVGCILVHPTFGKCPMTVSGADQQELRLAVAQSITHRGHVNALEIGW